LIDTYDTLAGAGHAAIVGNEMAERGAKLIGVRIDSGDLAAQARSVRKILDDAELQQVKIFGSGGLDEFDLADFASADAPFDSYGVGTKWALPLMRRGPICLTRWSSTPAGRCKNSAREKFPGRGKNKFFAN
jgi:nicotinic acid phosphoribosyltransferase